MSEDITLYDGSVLRNIHDEDECLLKVCAIHNPSAHPLRDEPMGWMGGGIRHLFRVCEHGFHHPDPDDMEFKKVTFDWMTIEAIASVHLMRENCDGCCQEAQK